MAKLHKKIKPDTTLYVTRTQFVGCLPETFDLSASKKDARLDLQQQAEDWELEVLSEDYAEHPTKPLYALVDTVSPYELGYRIKKGETVGDYLDRYYNSL